MKQKVFRAGQHSLAVIIPAGFTHAVGVKAGDTVEVRTDMGAGKVKLIFKGVQQLPLIESKRKRKGLSRLKTKSDFVKTKSK